MAGKKQKKGKVFRISESEKTGFESTNCSEDSGARIALERGLMVICECGMRKEHSGYDKRKEMIEQNGQNLCWENDGNNNHEPEFMCI